MRPKTFLVTVEDHLLTYVSRPRYECCQEGSQMTRSPQFKTTVTHKPDGTIVIVIEPVIVAPRGVDRNLVTVQDTDQNLAA